MKRILAIVGISFATAGAAYAFIIVHSLVQTTAAAMAAAFGAL